MYKLHIYIGFLLCLYSCNTDEHSLSSDFVSAVLNEDTLYQQNFIGSISGDDTVSALYYDLLSPTINIDNNTLNSSLIYQTKNQLLSAFPNEQVEFLHNQYLNNNIQANDLQKTEALYVYSNYMFGYLTNHRFTKKEFQALWNKSWYPKELDLYFKNQAVLLRLNSLSQQYRVEEIVLLCQFFIAYVDKYFENSFSHLKTKYRAEILQTLYSEFREDLYSETIKDLNELINDEIAKNNKNYISYEVVRLNQFFQDTHISDELKIRYFDNYKNPFEKIADKLKIESSLVFFERILGDKTAYERLLNTIPYFEFNSCHRMNIQFNERLSDLAKDKYVYDSLRLEIEKFNQCDDNLLYFQLIDKMYLAENIFRPVSSKEKIALYKERRSLGFQYFNDEINPHFQDLLAQNTTQLMSLYRELIKDNQEFEVAHILSLIEETKSINLKVKRIYDDENPVKLTYQSPRVKEILEITNDGLDMSYEGNPIFLELEDYLINEPEREPEKLDRKTLFNIDIEDIPVDLQVMEYIQHGYNYWFYYFQNGKIYIQDADVHYVDSLTTDLQQKIINKQDYLPTISLLQDTILAKAINDKPLLIIPDGNLSSLPYELLLSDNQRVSYHFSLSEYLRFQEKTLQDPQLTLFSYTDNSTLQSSEQLEYTELPIGWKEVQEVQKVIEESQIFSGKDFSEDTFLQNTGSNIYHISSHASFDGDNRSSNYILCRNPENGPERLYSYEIEEMENEPQVVILSACDTGNGKHIVGAGTYSLSRAFFYAGTETVIKSLWPVNEQASKELMVQLYENWKAGNTLEKALVLAKNELKQSMDYKHPFYWAGFILEGNGKIML